MSARTFLAFNGSSIVAEQVEIVVFVLCMASGDIDQTAAVMFFRDYCKPLDGVTK